MVRLIASLIVLAIVLVVRLIIWLAKPKTVVPNYNLGAGPGFGAGFGPPGPGGPPMGYGGPPVGGIGGPPMGYGAPPQLGYGAPPQGGYGAAPGYGPPAAAPGYGPPAAAPGYGSPPGAGAGPGYGAPGPVRILARPDCSFDRLSACMSQAGLRMSAQPGPQVQPGEPASAMWQSDGAQVRYSFDPGTYARIIEIAGPQAEQLRQHLQGQIG